jgi:hypothetical protein
VDHTRLRYQTRFKVASSSSNVRLTGTALRLPVHTHVCYANRYQCDECKSHDTIFSTIGGGGGQSRKDETWGSKDGADLKVSIDCRNCGRNWKEVY